MVLKVYRRILNQMKRKAEEFFQDEGDVVRVRSLGDDATRKVLDQLQLKGDYFAEDC